MKKILAEISGTAIKNADVPYTVEQVGSEWIGFAPALVEQVDALEHSLGLTPASGLQGLPAID